MALALVAVKLAGWAIPVALLVIFSAVWVFGAAMLWWYPVFGALGTAAYGLFLAYDLVAMHGAIALNVALSAGFVLGALLALGVLAQRLWSRAA
ncbi:MAG: hypothetical protein QOE90_1350 [Thermoplasmata archaeon]|nr:hypothetical protein [Thermoplasmata archaeon]